jgi:hypothetical protein
MLFADLAEGGELVKTGIGEQHVDATCFHFDGGVDPVDIGELRYVALNCHDVASDRGDGLVQLRLATACDEYLRALCGELPGGTKANAGAYDCDLTREFLVHGCDLSNGSC